MELRFDGGEIRKDVPMVELNVIEDEGPWSIMDEFGSLVEECRVIFIGFDDEEGRVAETRGYAEVSRDAANEEPWSRGAGLVEDEGQ